MTIEEAARAAAEECSYCSGGTSNRADIISRHMTALVAERDEQYRKAVDTADSAAVVIAKVLDAKEYRWTFGEGMTCLEELAASVARKLEVSQQQLSATGSLLDEAGIPDGGSTVTRVAMLVAARDEAVKLIEGAFK